MAKQIFIVRNATQRADKGDPPLSDLGVRQAIELAGKIAKKINFENLEIWSSPNRAAIETSEIIGQVLFHPTVIIEDTLGDDCTNRSRFEWLEEKIKFFNGDALVIVSGQEFVQDFPFEKLRMPENECQLAEGVLIEGSSSTLIKQ